MCKKYSLIILAILLSACSDQSGTRQPLTSGIDQQGMNLEVRPQDDFYEYANGGWLATTEIPADEVGWGSYMTLRKESLEQSRVIVVDAAENPGQDIGRQKIGDYFNAFMDQTAIEKLAITPIAADIANIDALKTHADIAGYFGRSNAIGVDGPLNLYVGQDDKDATN
ncbi:MAG: peptidase M13, partial [Porticoccaceae bacterium]